MDCQRYYLFKEAKMIDVNKPVEMVNSKGEILEATIVNASAAKHDECILVRWLTEYGATRYFVFNQEGENRIGIMSGVPVAGLKLRNKKMVRTFKFNCPGGHTCICTAESKEVAVSSFVERLNRHEQALLVSQYVEEVEE
jgi:hypothetical protein